MLCSPAEARRPNAMQLLPPARAGSPEWADWCDGMSHLSHSGALLERRRGGGASSPSSAVQRVWPRVPHRTWEAHEPARARKGMLWRRSTSLDRAPVLPVRVSRSGNGAMGPRPRPAGATRKTPTAATSAAYVTGARKSLRIRQIATALSDPACSNSPTAGS